MQKKAKQELEWTVESNQVWDIFVKEYENLYKNRKVDAALKSTFITEPFLHLTKRLRFVDMLRDSDVKLSNYVNNAFKSLSAIANKVPRMQRVSLPCVEDLLIKILVNESNQNGDANARMRELVNLLCGDDKKQVLAVDNAVKVKWMTTMRAWVHDAKLPKNVEDAAVNALYASKMYCIGFAMNNLDRLSVPDETVESLKNAVAEKTRTLVVATAEKKHTDRTAFEQHLEMIALVLMYCTVEVQIDAWHLRTRSHDRRPIFLETLFRNYANALTWLHVHHGIHARSNASWCVGTAAVKNERYDMLVVAHDLIESSFFGAERLDTVQATFDAHFCDVLEWLDFLATYRFSSTCSVKSKNSKKVEESDEMVVESTTDEPTSVLDTSEASLVALAIAARKKQKIRAANENISLWRWTGWTKEKINRDDSPLWTFESVFGVDMKTWSNVSKVNFELFLHQMAMAHLFPNVTLLLYLRNKSLELTTFKQAGLWYFKTSAWDLGDMLAAKSKSTVCVPGTVSKESCFLSAEAVMQRCFIVFDENKFRTFTNNAYELSGHFVPQYGDTSKFMDYLSDLLDRHLFPTSNTSQSVPCK